MLDVAWPEVIVIGAVALVVLGPKDLPKVMHALGRAVRTVQAFFNDLSARADQLAFEAELAERMKKTAEPAAHEAKTAGTSDSSLRTETDEGKAHGD
jgi:sec-independent protein translocase protein TatB